MKIERFAGSSIGFGASASAGQVAVAELRALAQVDDVLPPEAVDVSLVAPAAADLRMAQPPVRAPSGEALFRSLASFVEKFSAREAGAALAERKMGALLRGIHGLEVEIRSQIAHSARV